MHANIKLNTVTETLNQIRIGRTKLYEELKANRLRSVRIGRRRYISQTEIEHYVSSLPLYYPDRFHARVSNIDT